MNRKIDHSLEVPGKYQKSQTTRRKKWDIGELGFRWKIALVSVSTTILSS